MEEINKFVFIDTETTGLLREDRACQIAYSYNNFKRHYGNSLQTRERVTRNVMVNPQISISADASVTTGITNSMVMDKELFINTREYKELSLLAKEENTYFIAYNAPFDMDMLAKDGLDINPKNVIDLYRVVKHLYKNHTTTDRNDEEIPLSNNKLQYFRYLFNFDDKQNFKELVKDYGCEGVQAHDALGDIIVLEYFFDYVVDMFDLSLEEIIELSNKPVLEPNISFGNVFEKGTPFVECLTTTYEQYGRVKNGYDYLDWCSSNLSLSVDTEYSIKRHFFNLLIEDKIPYNNKFLKYINFGLVFETDQDKIEKGLEIIKQPLEYHQKLIKKFHDNMEKQYEENKNGELGDFFPFLFLKRFSENYLIEEEN